MKRILLATLLGVCTLSSALAQSDYVSDDDGKTTGGLWTELGATKVLPYDLSLGLDVGFRTNEWFNEADRFDVSLGLDWKPTKHWKFGIAYTFIMKHYPLETAYKKVTDSEWKYRALGDTVNTDFTDFMGAPSYTDPGGTKYDYRGFNQSQKNYTRVTEAYWRSKHRISLDATYSYKFWKWLRLSLRERYQLTFVPSKNVNRIRTGTKVSTKYRGPSYNTQGTLSADESSLESYDKVTRYYQEGSTIYSLDLLDETATPIDVTTSYLADNDNTYLNDPENSVKEKTSKTLHILRSRLSFEVDKKGWLWSPFMYFESFNNLGEGWHFDKIRLSAGVEYAVAPSHKLSVGYVFNHENDDDGDMNIHAISVGYKFKF